MFGVPYSRLDLALLPRYQSEIPVVLTILDCYLRIYGGYTMEGIFLQNGKEEQFLDAMSKMDMGYSLHEIFDHQAYSGCYIVGQLIKAFFREYEIIEPGFFSDKLLNSNENNEIKNEFNKINEPLKSIMFWLIDVCIDQVIYHKKHNKVTIENLAICLGPNLIRNKNSVRKSQIIFKRLLELRKNNELFCDENTNNKWYLCSLSNGIYGSYTINNYHYHNYQCNEEEKKEEKKRRKKKKR
eukprot:511387_1